MAKALSVAEVKRRFSEVTGEVAFAGKRYIIERKGKAIAALVGIKDLKQIEESQKSGNPRGLLAAIGVWEEFKGLDKIVKDIYKSRLKAKDRKIGGLN